MKHTMAMMALLVGCAGEASIPDTREPDDRTSTARGSEEPSTSTSPTRVGEAPAPAPSGTMPAPAPSTPPVPTAEEMKNGNDTLGKWCTWRAACDRDEFNTCLARESGKGQWACTAEEAKACSDFITSKQDLGTQGCKSIPVTGVPGICIVCTP